GQTSIALAKNPRRPNEHLQTRSEKIDRLAALRGLSTDWCDQVCSSNTSNALALQAACNCDRKTIRGDQPRPPNDGAKSRVLAQLDNVIEIQREDILCFNGTRILAN